MAAKGLDLAQADPGDGDGVGGAVSVGVLSVTVLVLCTAAGPLPRRQRLAAVPCLGQAGSVDAVVGGVWVAARAGRSCGINPTPLRPGDDRVPARARPDCRPGAGLGPERNAARSAVGLGSNVKSMVGGNLVGMERAIDEAVRLATFNRRRRAGAHARRR